MGHLIANSDKRAQTAHNRRAAVFSPALAPKFVAVPPLLQLQQTLGNQAVQRLMQAKLTRGAEAERMRQKPLTSTMASLIQQQAAPSAATCPVAPITPITDANAQAMESGTRVIWNNTSPGLRAAANTLVGLILAEPGGTATITSAYRPQAYQDHLREVWDKARALQNNTASACAAVRAAVNREMQNHSLAVNRPVARISNHRAGNAVDISWTLPNAADEEARIDALAAQAGLTHRLHQSDRPHFEI